MAGVPGQKLRLVILDFMKKIADPIGNDPVNMIDGNVLTIIEAENFANNALSILFNTYFAKYDGDVYQMAGTFPELKTDYILLDTSTQINAIPKANYYKVIDGYLDLTTSKTELRVFKDSMLVTMLTNGNSQFEATANDRVIIQSNRNIYVFPGTGNMKLYLSYLKYPIKENGTPYAINDIEDIPFNEQWITVLSDICVNEFKKQAQEA